MTPKGLEERYPGGSPQQKPAPAIVGADIN